MPRDGLKDYRDKRRFAETPEPSDKGRLRPRSKKRRYAIQKHDATRLHYDLRLELDGVLKSWAVTKGPSLDPSEKRLAVRTEDHPLDYVDFEGTIPKGNYGAGTVMLWDRGTWEPLGDPVEGLEAGKLSFRIEGERLKGKWALVRFKGKRKDKRENWLLIKEKDDAVDRRRNLTKEGAKSVKSGRKMDEIAETASTRKKNATKKSVNARRLPAFVEPQLATLVKEVPKRGDWLYEIKFDGYRVLAAVDGERARLFTRNGKDWTERFPAIAEALGELDLDGCLLDGEVVALDRHGRSSFGRLQRAFSGDGIKLSFFAFDLLETEGRSVRSEPLTERKERLRKLLEPASRKGPIYFTDHVENDGQHFWDEMCRRGFEGAIAKKADARYRSGRGKSWLKLKCTREQEFVIVGWSTSDKDRPFSSLLLGTHEGGELRYAGRVGTGFSEDELGKLARRFRSIARKTSPLDGEVPASVRRGARWVTPEVVVQVGFAEFTDDGLVRHARYLGLREDKDAGEVKREEPVSNGKAKDGGSEKSGPVEIAGVRLTHPERVLYPEQGVTKRDLAEYLEAAAERMLPYLDKRPVSLVRCPEGRQKSCFFQRHGGAGLPDTIGRVTIEEDDGGKADYLTIDSVEALIAAAQMGALEFHIWGSRADRLERPDRIVFDLDPGPDVAFSAVREAAQDTRERLQNLGLESFPLLTGGKGVHVVAPLERRHDWDSVKAFSAALARRMAEQDPKRYVAVSTKAKRKGRIFIDYLRNGRSASAICPFSPRAREGAPVAWPIDWKSLEETKAANGILLPDARERLGERDPWLGYDDLRQRLTKQALTALEINGN